jgi:MFS transporter, NNP family, nitrate/nitrite transporter
VIFTRLRGLIKDFFPFPLSPLFLLVGIFYVNFVCRASIAPLLPVIKAELGLGLTKAGSLFFVMALGYCGGLFLSGFVASRLNHRHAILLSAGGMGVAMMGLSQAASLSTMYLSLIMAGLSSGLYLPSGIAMVIGLVPSEHWGKGLAIHELAPNLGFITAPLLAELFLRLFSWRGIFAFIGSWSILTGLIFLFFGRGEKRKGEAPRLSAVRDILSRPVFWMMTAFFVFSVGASFGFYSMMPLFLVSERGMSRELANTLTSLSRVAGLLTIFIAGWITDRAGHKRAAVLFLSTTGGLIVLVGLIHNPGFTTLLVVLQASAAVCAFPAGFSILSHGFPPVLRGLAVSLVTMIAYLLGAGVFPLGIGYVAERFSFSWSFFLQGFFTLCMVPFLLKVRMGESEEMKNNPNV